MKTLIKILICFLFIFGVLWVRECKGQSLNSFEFRRDMLIVFAEHSSYKVQSEIVDSIANELTKAKQIIWIKDLEIKNEQDKIVSIHKTYEDYELKREWWDRFGYGFAGSSILFIIGVIIGIVL